MNYKPWSLFGQRHDPDAARRGIRAARALVDRFEADGLEVSIYGSLVDPNLPFTEGSDVDALIEADPSPDRRRELRQATRLIESDHGLSIDLTVRERSAVDNPNMCHQLARTRPGTHPLLLIVGSTLRSAYDGMKTAQRRYCESTTVREGRRHLDTDNDDQTTRALLSVLQRPLCHTTNALLRRLLLRLDGPDFMGTRAIEDTDGIRQHLRDAGREHPGIRPPILSEETTEYFSPHIETLNERPVDPSFETVRRLYETLPGPMRCFVRDVRKYGAFLKDRLNEWPEFRPVLS